MRSPRRSVPLFHWIDGRDRDRLQTGLVRASNTIKPAAKAVENAISTGCVSQHSRWRHSTGVNGAAVTWKPKSGYAFHAKAHEDSTFTATATPTKKAVKQVKKPGKKLKPRSVSGKLKAYIAHGVKFNGINAATAPSYTYGVKISAALNPHRRVTLKHNRLLKL